MRTDCGACRAHYRTVKRKTVPCETEEGCLNEIPELWVSNSFTWEMFSKVSGQVIVAGMGEPIGIKFEAIQFLFELYNVPDDERIDIFEKIMAIDTVRMNYRKQELIKQKSKAKK